MLVKTKSKALTALKIIWAILIVAITAFLVWGAVDTFIQESNNDGSFQGLGIALYLIYFVMILGSIGYGVTVIIAIAGLIVSIVKKYKGSSVFFIFAIIIPVVTEFLIIYLCKILSDKL